MKEAVCSAHFLSKASMPAGIMTLATAVALPQNGSLVALKKDAKIAAFGVLKYVYTSCGLTSSFRHSLHLF